MTQNALTVMRFIFAWGWRFLTGFTFPGTNVTPGAVLFFGFFVYISLVFIRRILSVTPSDSSKSSGKKG